MGKKPSPQDVLDRIRTEFPELSGLHWSDLMGHDSEVLTQMLGDVIKVDNRSSRPGKRPALSREVAEAELLRISANSYSDVDFLKTFNALTHGKSIRNVANKCSISKMQVQRLKTGEIEPSLEQMEKIAKAYRKDPAYFLEYRVACVLYSVSSFLTSSPETCTNWFLKMRRSNRGRI